MEKWLEWCPEVFTLNLHKVHVGKVVNCSENISRILSAVISKKFRIHFFKAFSGNFKEIEEIFENLERVLEIFRKNSGNDPLVFKIFWL